MVYNGTWRRVADTVFAPHCLLCGASGAASRDICSACAGELPVNAQCCVVCAAPLPQRGGAYVMRTCGRCLRRRPTYRRAYAAFVYAPPLDYLVRCFKFDGRLEYGRLLGQLFAERSAGIAAQNLDCLLPVPLHATRLRARGFNQAMLLARELRRAFTIPVARNTVVRTRATPVQTALHARQRQRNVRGAFRLHYPVRGLRIALVDDVLTTGATVDELARLLLRSGAADVIVWALARAQTPRR